MTRLAHPQKEIKIQNSTRNKGLSIVHQNAQIATNKEDELSLLCDELKPDVLLVSETGYSETTIKQFSIENYNLANYFCREIHKGGGVAILTKQNLTFDSWKLRFSEEKHFESAGIKIKTKHSKLHIIGLYRSPSGNIDKFFQQFEALLYELTSKQLQFILMGDININVLDYDNPITKRFSDTLTSFDLKWSVSSPTRVTPSSETAIDNVITNCSNTQVTVIKTAISDHDAQRAVFWDCLPTKEPPHVRIGRNLCPNNIWLLNRYLAEERWGLSQHLTAEEKFQNFNDTFLYYLNVSCPLKSKRNTFSYKVNNWITPGILVSRDKLKFLSLVAKGSSDLELQNFVKKYKRTYRKVIKAAKAYDVTKQLQNSKNLSKTAWKIINKNSKTSTGRSIELRGVDGLIADPVKVSNEFNTFFASVAEQIRVNTRRTVPLCERSPADSLLLSPVMEQEVAQVIQQLPTKHTNDLNFMSTWLLKKCSRHIIQPLTEAINSSFKEGTFPSSLKLAKVIPIHKKDDPHSLNNYRPISILPVFSKIFEKLFLNRLMKFLEKHNLLSKDQFGFRAGKSTTDAVVSLIDMVVEGLESGEFNVGIFLDLSKAFDCVDHQILLQRLQSYGIRGEPHQWLTSYLTDRTQTVQIGQHNSSILKLRYGVPQGSILSPLLFLIYVNDTGSSLLHGRLVQYADDTTLYFKSNSKESLELRTFENLNACIQHFHQINLMTNASKSKYINFHLRPRSHDQGPIVMVDDTILEDTDSIKFLGIHLDRSLNWNHHVDSVCSRVSSGIFALRNLGKFCPVKILLMAYFGLVYPHITYGISLWGGCSNSSFTRIFRLQKKAVRTILKLNNRESCRAGFVELGLLTLPCLYILQTIMFFLSKCVLTRGQDIHTYETRGRGNYRMGQHRTVVHERLPSQAGVMFVNSLPDRIKSIPTAQALRTELKRVLVSRAFYSVGEFVACQWETDELAP